MYSSLNPSPASRRASRARGAFVRATLGDIAMLDIEYASLSAFVADCTLVALDANVILASGEFVVLDSGRVIAADCL